MALSVVEGAATIAGLDVVGDTLVEGTEQGTGDTDLEESKYRQPCPANSIISEPFSSCFSATQSKLLF